MRTKNPLFLIEILQFRENTSANTGAVPASFLNESSTNHCRDKHGLYAELEDDGVFKEAFSRKDSKRYRNEEQTSKE